MKNPAPYSLPPRNEKPKAGAARLGRSRRTTRTLRSSGAALRARPEPDVVEAVDVAYIANLEIKTTLIPIA